MKKSILVLALIGGALFMNSCSNDDDTTVPVNEEEVITTLLLTLVPDGGGATVTMQSRDLDGDGPNAPTVEVSGNLQASTTYTGVVLLTNETETPADNITLEVIEEADEHQMFYLPSGSLNITVAYLDTDGNGDPLGVSFTFTTGDASNGNLNAVLRHEPNKPNDGTLADAGGETDIDVTFPVTVE